MRTRLLLVVIAALALLTAMAGPAAARSRDRDRDRLPDRWETRFHLSTNVKNAAADPDRDGLSNLGELRSGTSPRDPDSNNNGTEDGDEDRDRDGVDNGNELAQGTSPQDRDSDDDGRNDGREDRDRDGLSNAGEDRTGNDPRDRDTDDDGTLDGKETVGTVASFKDGVLTITLPDGTSVSGAVTDQTEIGCESEDELEDGTSPVVVAASDDDAREDDADEQEGDNSDRGPRGRHRDDNDGPGTDNEHDGDEDNRCTTADLAPGTRVHEAEIKLSPTGPWFEEVKLVK
jgi:hypothetical protein